MQQDLTILEISRKARKCTLKCWAPRAMNANVLGLGLFCLKYAEVSLSLGHRIRQPCLRQLIVNSSKMNTSANREIVEIYFRHITLSVTIGLHLVIQR